MSSLIQIRSGSGPLAPGSKSSQLDVGRSRSNTASSDKSSTRGPPPVGHGPKSSPLDISRSRSNTTSSDISSNQPGFYNNESRRTNKTYDESRGKKGSLAKQQEKYGLADKPGIVHNTKLNKNGVMISENNNIRVEGSKFDIKGNMDTETNRIQRRNSRTITNAMDNNTLNATSRRRATVFLPSSTDARRDSRRSSQAPVTINDRLSASQRNRSRSLFVPNEYRAKRRASSRGDASANLPRQRWRQFGRAAALGEMREADEEESYVDKDRCRRRFVQRVQLLLALLNLQRRATDTVWRNDVFTEQRDVLDTTVERDEVEFHQTAFFDPTIFKADRQMRTTQEAKRILRKDPDDRTPEEIRYATIALRSIQLIADYPARMQANLAQHGRFEAYEAGRVIVKEGHPPVAFYFILYGTVIVAVLNERGDEAETQCYLHRGDSFGELSIMHRSARQSTVICKGHVELLSIDTQTYEKVFMVGGARNLHDHDHEQFIRKLPFLKEWPIELLQNPDPEVMVFTYFKRNSVVVKDSNYSKWLYIVKSGSVRVLKKLARRSAMVDKNGTRDRPVTQLDILTTFTSSTYPNELQDLLYRKCNIVLPSPRYPPNDYDNEGVMNDAIEDEDIVNGDDAIEDEDIMDDDDDGEEEEEEDGHDDDDATPSPEAKTATAGKGVQRAQSAVDKLQRDKQGLLKTGRCKSAHPKQKSTSPVMNGAQEEAAANGHGRRTFLDDLDSGYKEREQIVTEADLDPEFVHIQTLTKGDVFGLNSILFADQPGCCLVSNGADCILLDKQYYEENCSEKFIRHLKCQVSPYPTDEKLQDDLQTQVNWEAYKKIVLKQQLKTKPHKTSHSRRVASAWQ